MSITSTILSFKRDPKRRTNDDITKRLDQAREAFEKKDISAPRAAHDPDVAFAVSIVPSGLALFTLGTAKVLITERSWFRSGLEMLLVGSVAAGVAYLVGFLLQGLVATGDASSQQSSGLQ